MLHILCGTLAKLNSISSYAKQSYEMID